MTTGLDSDPIEATPTLVNNNIEAATPAPTVAPDINTVPSTSSNAAMFSRKPSRDNYSNCRHSSDESFSSNRRGDKWPESDLASSRSIEASNWQTISDLSKDSSSSSTALADNGLDSIVSLRAGFGSGETCIRP